MAKLIERLTAAEVGAIGVDIFFPEKDLNIPIARVTKEVEEKDFTSISKNDLDKWLEDISNPDAKFSQTILESDRTVLGYFVYAPGDPSGEEAEILNETHLELLDFSQYSMVKRTDNKEAPANLQSIHAVGMSLPVLMNAANSAGYVSFFPQGDGVVRWVPLIMQHGDFLFPPLSLQTLQQAEKVPLRADISSLGIDSIQLGEINIPTTDKGNYLINYYGPPSTFTNYSATDILSGEIGANELEGKIVLVGGTAPGVHDTHSSPYGLFPGVEIHANIIESIINRDFLLRPEWLLLMDLLVILMSGLLLGLAAIYFKGYVLVVLLFSGISGYLALDWYLFNEEGLWVHTVYPVISQIFVYSGIMLYHYLFEERNKKFLKGAFSKYIAPTLVEGLEKRPELLRAGGEKKFMTVFFSDVEGFTSISEQLEPSELISFTNEYLTAMTAVVLDEKGIINQYGGDSIMASFGAPMETPEHVNQAVRAGIKMQRRLNILNVEWKKRGLTEIRCRIGITTDTMYFGNLGSQQVYYYTPSLRRPYRIGQATLLLKI
jgi:adenylate cyclase